LELGFQQISGLLDQFCLLMYVYFRVRREATQKHISLAVQERQKVHCAISMAYTILSLCTAHVHNCCAV